MKDKLTISRFLCASLLCLAACDGTTVLGGGDTAGDMSTQGSGGSTSSSSGAGSSAGSAPAIAMSYQQLPDPPASLTAVPIGNDYSSQATPLVPDTLILFWSNEPEACSSGYVDGVSGQQVWQTALTLPPLLLTVGTIDLSSAGIYLYNYYQDVDANITSGTVGYLTGTIEIVSIDSTSVTVNLLTPLQGDPSDGAVPLQGIYTLRRC